MARIPLWPVDLPSRLRVHIDPTVDGGIAVRLGRVVRVVGGRGSGRLALVRQGPSHELVARRASMCVGLQRNNKLCRIER